HFGMFAFCRLADMLSVGIDVCYVPIADIPVAEPCNCPAVPLALDESETSVKDDIRNPIRAHFMSFPRCSSRILDGVADVRLSVIYHTVASAAGEQTNVTALNSAIDLLLGESSRFHRSVETHSAN